MSEIDDLRKLVSKRRASATRKISRTRKVNGVDLSGTNLDPRRDIKIISKYNKAQLVGYLAKLDSFIDRTVQYYGGSKGIVHRGADMRVNNSLQNRWNKVVATHYEAIKDIRLPSHTDTNGNIILSDRTVGRRRAELDQGASSSISNRPMDPVNRTPKQIKDVQAAISDLNSRLSKEYYANAIAEQRDQNEKMLMAIGAHDLIDASRNLSDFQFDVMFNESGYARDASLKYDMVQRMARGESLNRGQLQVMEQISDELGEFYKWAELLPKSAEEAIAKNNKEKARKRR